MANTIQHKELQAKGIVTRSPSGQEEQEYIEVPISSTAVDRDGDEFSRKGLEDLRDQIKSKPRPVFENHGFSGDGGGGMFGAPLRYDWKDIIGSLDDAEIKDDVKTDGDDGTVDVLNGYVRPNPENERGQKLIGYVKADMPVGFSIGFGVGNSDEKDDGGLIFHKTDLMEVSSVGIQSNRESVATNAADTAVAMAKQAGQLDAVDIDEPTLARAIVSEIFEKRDETSSSNSTPVERVQKQTRDDSAEPESSRIDSLTSDIKDMRGALDDIEPEDAGTKSVLSDDEGESTDDGGEFEL